MNDKQLAGKKVAILVESQYIPAEIRIYQQRFAFYGATVDLVSRLWGQSSARFYSTVEPGVQDAIEWLDVTLDVDHVNLDDYAAIVVAANYVSVRLRWSERDDVTAANVAAIAREVPAARFMRRAMLKPTIIKGLPCHALWLLTPSPEVLAGRRVICNKVVLADVLNAGAIYTPCAPNTPDDQIVVVDGDLVTNDGWHSSAELVDRIRDLIVNPPPPPVDPPTSPTVSQPGKRRILILLSERGYWGEELVGPLEEFIKTGYEVKFCTPRGRRPNAIPVSMDAEFLDPPLNRPVTTEAMAALVREYDDPATMKGQLLDHPLDLSGWFPERPYFSAPTFVRGLEAYNRELVKAEHGVKAFDALLIVGGSGPLIDLVNNQRVHDLILAFLKVNKPIGAECYGVACLAFARDMNLRRSIIWGKHVTGHCLEYDYKDGTAFVESRGKFFDFNMGPPPYPLEFILRDATGPDGKYHGNFGCPTSVIVDYPFITGRSTPDSVLTGKMMIKVLDGDPPDPPVRRWGW